MWHNGLKEMTPAGNRGLTHSSESTREGLAINATPNVCIPAIDGAAKFYQVQARAVFERAFERPLMPWSWISTTCGDQCLNPEHLVNHSPHRIAYPAGVCVYCGMVAGTKDHLLPKPLTGEARRRFVAIVPACAYCNSRIGDLPSFCITDRRAKAHAGIRKKYRTLLGSPNWSDRQMAEHGPLIRKVMESKRALRAQVNAQLNWPDDPLYDIAAFQRSGIDDPVLLGLIAPLPARWRG